MAVVRWRRRVKRARKFVFRAGIVECGDPVRANYWREGWCLGKLAREDGEGGERNSAWCILYMCRKLGAWRRVG